MKSPIQTLALPVVLVASLAILAACSDDKASNNTSSNSSQTTNKETIKSSDTQTTEASEQSDKEDDTEKEMIATDTKRGLYVYYADSAQFTDCTNGNVYPVAQEKAAAELETTYLALRDKPQQKLFIEVKGEYDMRPPMEGDDIEMLIPMELLEVVNTDSCS